MRALETTVPVLIALLIVRENRISGPTERLDVDGEHPWASDTNSATYSFVGGADTHGVRVS